ncbi:hypothetical protein D9758_005334 [Tetrapyrgos nigripes]|uniref:Uncharacterized protein n=1 Tax=Tetrapyrgos nigripes TaxID=182062 RepID=A0A8H5LQ31_9AGAR|nr:hypothetical protein D9758_005334 [Tetrapyrgos nigripes]
MTSPKESYALPSLPPAAHHSTAKAKQTPVINEQPPASSGMVIGGSHTQNREQSGEDGPMRLRGGCFPLPGGGVCYCIPIPCCC